MRTVPALPDPFVPRPRLLATLDDTGGDGAVLVCAPAGFGKTTLLAHWARSAEAGTAVAWVDVHRLHADPGQLWPTILTAITACPAVPPDSAHEIRRAAWVWRAAPELGSAIVDALDALPARITLVLHDIHELVDAAALKSLEPLVVARSAGLRVLLCSRWDPPLSVGELRSAGSLQEVRVDQLRFTAAETGGFLHRSGLQLARGLVDTVHACTDGWPGAVRLTAAALHGAADVQEFLERFAAHPGPAADFLVGEALADRPNGGAPVARSSADLLVEAYLRAGRPKRTARHADPRAGVAHRWTAPVRTPGRREDLRPVHLDDTERRVLAHLSSPLSVERIAGELRVPIVETKARMRAIYRKLGVSSRRSAVTAAYERGLMR